MTIGNKRRIDHFPEIKLNNQVIKNTLHHKHVRLTLSYNLRWNAHINDIAIKASKRLDLMKALKFKLDRKSLETIYFSFVRPIMEYACVVWGGTYDSDLCKLDQVQVEAMRLVTGATARSSIQGLYDETGWPTLGSRREVQELCYMYKIMNNLAPTYLTNIVPSSVNELTPHNLRSGSNIRIPKFRTESYKRSFFPRMLSRWNSLEDEVKQRPTLLSFKLSLKTPKDRSKEIYYYGQRWPSVHHARIRIGCSKLNSHLCYNLHVIPSPQCPCGFENEDPLHYFFICPQHVQQRVQLFNTVSHITDLNLSTLLFGSTELSMQQNKIIFDAVHNFIVNTGRFDD